MTSELEQETAVVDSPSLGWGLGLGLKVNAV